MKEYICKEDLLNKADVDLDIEAWIISIEEMDELSTVTKTDICREFIDYVKFCDKTYMKPQVMKHPDYYKGYDSAFRFFEQILVEMEHN